MSLAAATMARPAAALSLSTHLFAQPPPPALLVAVAATRPHLASTTRIGLGRIPDLVAGQAMILLGTHYRLGASGDGAIDCSALVQSVFYSAGLELPRTTREQALEGVPVRMSDLRKGDLLFYRWHRRQLHVAVYMDGGFILHASSGKGEVVLTQLNATWARRMVAARRVL